MAVSRALQRRLSRLACAGALIAAGLAAPGQAYGISGGGEVADGAYRFVAKVDVVGGRGCSGVLIDPQWIATGKSCFAENEPIRPGPPAKATTVTVGRANALSETDG